MKATFVPQEENMKSFLPQETLKNSSEQSHSLIMAEMWSHNQAGETTQDKLVFPSLDTVDSGSAKKGPGGTSSTAAETVSFASLYGDTQETGKKRGRSESHEQAEATESIPCWVEDRPTARRRFQRRNSVTKFSVQVQQAAHKVVQQLLDAQGEQRAWHYHRQACLQFPELETRGVNNIPKAA